VIEARLEALKFVIQVSLFQRTPARKAELIVLQSIISFSGNSDLTAIVLQAGTWPEGILAPEGASEIVLARRRILPYSASTCVCRLGQISSTCDLPIRSQFCTENRGRCPFPGAAREAIDRVKIAQNLGDFFSNIVGRDALL
jgi:hypothetical protein